MYSTPFFPSMSSTYPKINWLILPAYHPLQNFWQNCDFASTPSTGNSPPRFWSLIGSRSFIFCTIPELVVVSHTTLVRWLVWCRWSYPSPTYMVTSLPSFVCSRTFTILAWMILTSMVLSSLIWTTWNRSNTPPSNFGSLIHSVYDFPGTSPVVLCFTQIVPWAIYLPCQYHHSIKIYLDFWV